MKNYYVKNKNYCVNNEKYCVNKLMYCVNNFGFDIQTLGCAQLASPQGSLNFVNPYPDLCNLQGNAQETELFFYHPDHLGSTGMVTDNLSNITAGYLYAPFGEILQEHSAVDNRIPKYAFNAKELDEENGMYYYSARYYAPPTFISRDPMFEKKPSITSYAYCANNPIKYIDPTGEDEYEFDKKGNLLNIITNDKADILRVVRTDRKGNIKRDKHGNTKTIATSKNFDAGSISCGGSEELRNGNSTEKAVVFEMSQEGEKNRVAMFEFLAENTKVEWGTFSGTDNKGNYLGRLTTSHDKDIEYASTILINDFVLQSYKISEWYHSHPYDFFENTVIGPSGYHHNTQFVQYSVPYGQGDHGVAIYYKYLIPNLKVYDVQTRTYYTFKVGGYSKDAK